MKNTTPSEPFAPPASAEATTLPRVQIYRQTRTGAYTAEFKTASAAEAVEAFLDHSPAFEGGELRIWNHREPARERIGGVEHGENRLRFSRFQPHECVSRPAPQGDRPTDADAGRDSRRNSTQRSDERLNAMNTTSRAILQTVLATDASLSGAERDTVQRLIDGQAEVTATAAGSDERLLVTQ